MNTLLKEAAGSVQGGWILGLVTVLFILSFLWWLWYAYAPGHKQMMEEAARMPFDDGGAS
jgi:cbb3-type cytochrome oxidase subunit 3